MVIYEDKIFEKYSMKKVEQEQQCGEIGLYSYNKKLW